MKPSMEVKARIDTNIDRRKSTNSYSYTSPFTILAEYRKRDGIGIFDISIFVSI
jgi:hypothetical protein